MNDNLKEDLKERLEEVRAYKESKIPINIEIDKLFNDVFPYKKLYSIFKLGHANIIASLKNNCWECFDEYGQKVIDAIIEGDLQDEEMKYFYDKLLKKQEDIKIE